MAVFDLVSRAALHPGLSLGEEAGRPWAQVEKMSGDLSWGRGVQSAMGSKWRWGWGWGGNKREAEEQPSVSPAPELSRLTCRNGGSAKPNFLVSRNLGTEAPFLAEARPHQGNQQSSCCDFLFPLISGSPEWDCLLFSSPFLPHPLVAGSWFWLMLKIIT